MGAASREGTPTAAPLPLTMLGQSGAVRGGRLRGLEAEVAFVLRHDLPARSVRYTEEEVYAAVESCHPAIEILESALTDPTRPEVKMTAMADLQMHGGLILGPECAGWRAIDFQREPVTLAIDGMIRMEETGSNPSGNLLRLLPWLANEGAGRTGGLKAGQWITTGSWTGNTPARSGSVVDVHFATVGRVNLRFE